MSERPPQIIIETNKCAKMETPSPLFQNKLPKPKITATATATAISTSSGADTQLHKKVTKTRYKKSITDAIGAKRKLF